MLNGRFGPYFTCDKINYKIPKGTDPASLTFEKCKELMAAQPDAGIKKKGFAKKTPAAKKASTTKKAPATKKTTKAKK